MQVKRYEVANVQDAIQKIKHDLGPDAVILSTKKLNRRGSSLLEVLAARDLDLTEAEQGTLPAMNRPEREKGFADKRYVDISSILKSNHLEIQRLLKNLANEDLRMELTEVRESLSTFFDVLGLKKNKEENRTKQVYYTLISKGVSKEKAWQAAEKLKKRLSSDEIEHRADSSELIEIFIEESLPSTDFSEKEGRIKVFIGPTGVGKTTTLAKLSAHFVLGKKKTVGLITTDTYRIAAVEQLKTYSRIIGIPLEIAQSRGDVIKAFRRFENKDIIFVDTPGTSRNDSMNLEKLNETLKSEYPLERNLLISLTSSKECMIDVASRYKIFDYDRVILTKADECIKIGYLWDVLDQISKPVSYITNGQSVPNDIEKASRKIIAKMIMGNYFN